MLGQMFGQAQEPQQTAPTADPRMAITDIMSKLQDLAASMPALAAACQQAQQALVQGLQQGAAAPPPSGQESQPIG